MYAYKIWILFFLNLQKTAHIVLWFAFSTWYYVRFTHVDTYKSFILCVLCVPSYDYSMLYLFIWWTTPQPPVLAVFTELSRSREMGEEKLLPWEPLSERGAGFKQRPQSAVQPGWAGPRQPHVSSPLSRDCSIFCWEEREDCAGPYLLPHKLLHMHWGALLPLLCGSSLAPHGPGFPPCCSLSAWHPVGAQ